MFFGQESNDVLRSQPSFRIYDSEVFSNLGLIALGWTPRLPGSTLSRSGVIRSTVVKCRKSSGQLSGKQQMYAKTEKERMTHRPPDCGTRAVEAPAETHVVQAGRTKQQELICALRSLNPSKKSFPNPEHRISPLPYSAADSGSGICCLAKETEQSQWCLDCLEWERGGEKFAMALFSFIFFLAF